MNEYELYHHGVKGMKWGVRRYQNKDGSYTRIGLEHYKKAEARYDAVDKKYKTAKTAYKKGTGTKKDMVSAKTQRKIEKHRLDQAFDQVTRDYKADRGKELRAQGKTITGNSMGNMYKNFAIKVGAGVAANYAAQRFANTTLTNRFGSVNVGSLSSKAIRNGARLVAAYNTAKTMSDNSSIRSAYNHTRNYRDPDMKKGRKN